MSLGSSEHDERGRRVISYADAQRQGMRLFARTANLDMQMLAEDMAVSRATLYRVVPGRDRLLGDVLWGFAQPMFDRAARGAQGQGAEHVLDALRRFGAQIMGNEVFRRFLTDDPDTATRVLFTPGGGVHERFVAATEALIEPVMRRGTLTTAMDLGALAYVIARIYESFWYADLLNGRSPDLDDADRAARAVLGLSTTQPTHRRT